MKRMPGTMSVRDVDEIGFQRREWVVERVWWAVLALLLVAALLGLFSSGPLSESTSGGPEAGVEVQYERFLRHTAKATWTIRVQPGAVESGKATVFVSDELAQAMQMQHVSPQPLVERSTRTGVELVFAAPRADSPPLVRLAFRADAIGLRDGTIRSDDGSGAPIWLFIYP